MQKSKKMSRSSRQVAPERARVRPRWTKSEISILKRLYRTNSNAEIAKVLGRKVSSVVFKAHRLGFSKGIRRLREMGRENIKHRWKPRKNKSAKKSSNKS